MEPMAGVKTPGMNAYAAPTERTRVRRLPQRASYDVETVHAILDAGLVCTVSFVEDGRPVAIPTAYARVGDALVFHGSAKSRTLLAAAAGAELCVTVTHLDGLVLARSAFHHSVNYRSVVVFGRGVAVTDAQRKLALLEAFVERLYPGRWSAARRPNEQELTATLVVELPLHEAVAKVRTGGPLDDDADMTWPVWAGLIPLRLEAGEPAPAGGQPGECAPPAVDWAAEGGETRDRRQAARNKAAARAVFEVWASGALERLDALVAPDVVHHDPYDPDASEGLEGMKTTITTYRDAFPDVRFTIEDQIAAGDEVATRWTSTATHRGPLMGAAPSGKRVTLTGLTIDRFAGGKIVEAWRNWDVWRLVRSIGVSQDVAHL
jgi:uncharacterized protein